MNTERWTPVVIKHHGEVFEKDVFEKYEVSDICNVRNAKTKKVLGGKNERVTLSGDGKHKHLRRHRICLASFFPDEIPIDINNYDVDHIDGDHNNNVLSNLQWLSRSEHRKKTMTQTKGQRKSLVEKAGKKIKVIGVKGDGKKKYLGRVFESTTCATRELKLKQGCVSSSALNGYWVDDKYKFQFVKQPILEGEIFKPLGDYEISNKGRVIMKRGNITRGSNLTNSKYRVVFIKLENDIKKRSYYVHVLVWMAFIGPIPDGMVIMHNDTYDTLDEEGYERNWLEDLSLGTSSENAQSYHNNRTDLKRVRCLDNGREYFCGAEAARDLGLDNGCIHMACKKKIKTTGGYRFEYV